MCFNWNPLYFNFCYLTHVSSIILFFVIWNVLNFNPVISSTVISHLALPMYFISLGLCVFDRCKKSRSAGNFAGVWFDTLHTAFCLAFDVCQILHYFMVPVSLRPDIFTDFIVSSPCVCPNILWALFLLMSISRWHTPSYFCHVYTEQFSSLGFYDRVEN